MNKTLLIFLITLFTGEIIYSQCCPYVGDLEIIPENPTLTDSIYIITHVTTPNVGAFLGSDITTNSNNQIIIRSCYIDGFLTSPTYFTDTINLGIITEGEYSIHFTALSSSSASNCIPIDSNSVDSIFEVSMTSAITEKINDKSITCFPNPIISQNLRVHSIRKMEKIELLDIDGKLMFEKNNLTMNQYEINMNPLKAGIYFLNITDENNRKVFKKILKIK